MENVNKEKKGREEIVEKGESRNIGNKVREGKRKGKKAEEEMKERRKRIEERTQRKK